METTPRRRARIAAELRAEMARQKMTVVALSEATEIKVSTLRNRLAGKSPFYIEELDTICTELSVGLSAFVDRTELAA
jgi:DNA-binding Xre family transcriptional regulator